MSMKMEELEEELKEISAELASSIRREMELEDEVERLQQEAPTGLDPNRRTSDYFSDSGTSSVRYPLSENGTKVDDLEKMKRRSEQEKAQLKLDVSQKLQEERGQRKALEAHIKSLEQRLDSVSCVDVLLCRKLNKCRLSAIKVEARLHLAAFESSRSPWRIVVDVYKKSDSIRRTMKIFCEAYVEKQKVIATKGTISEMK